MSYEKLLTSLPKTIKSINNMKKTDGFDDPDHVQEKIYKIMTHIEKYKNRSQFWNIYKQGSDKWFNSLEKYWETLKVAFLKHLGIDDMDLDVFKSNWAILQLRLDWELIGSFSSEEDLENQDVWQNEYEAFKKALFHLLVSLVPEWPTKIKMIITYIENLTEKTHSRWSYLSFNSVTWVNGSSFSGELIEKILEKYNIDNDNEDAINFLSQISDEFIARISSIDWNHCKKKAKGHSKKVAKTILKYFK